MRGSSSSSQVGSELAYDGGLALFCVCIFIMLYLAVRFEWKFSVSAIVANFHDVCWWSGCSRSSAGVLAARAGGRAGGARLFGQRMVTFRPGARAFPHDAQGECDRGDRFGHQATISRTIITHGCTLMMTVTMLCSEGLHCHYFRAGPDAGHLLRRVLVGIRAAAIARWLAVKREDLVSRSRRKNSR